MAKHNCAICGAEVGLTSEQKLADGNYICRKVCSKKTLKIFEREHATLEEVTAHIAQVEKGTKIWYDLLLPLKKAKKKDEKLKVWGTGGPLLYVSPSTGLVAIVETRYKFIVFGKSQLACVYRLADLVRYDFLEERVNTSDGKTEKKQYAYLFFKGTDGMAGFPLEVSSKGTYDKLVKYFDTQFGIQKTLGNTINNAKRQINAIKTAAKAIKSAKDGTFDEAQAYETYDVLDVTMYGDRTEWIAKADAALEPYK